MIQRITIVQDNGNVFLHALPMGGWIYESPANGVQEIEDAEAMRIMAKAIIEREEV